MKKLSLFLSTIGLLSIQSNANAADLAKGKAIFTERCVMCHGPNGAGDGPVAQTLPPENRPRNLQTDGFKVAKDDAKLKELLQKGGAALGLNPLMPPAVGLSDADLDNLIAFVRSLHK